MKRTRKITALSFVMMMGLTLFACGRTDEESIENPASVEMEEKQAIELTDDVREIEMPLEDGETIYVYSWNQELGNKLNYFKEAYPQYADRVEFVNLGLEGNNDEYKTAIETLLQAGHNGTDKYPSIFAVGSDSEQEYVQSDYTVALDTIGIDKSDIENMYQYTLNYASFDGNMKALTWQATPGCFLYRTDIAKEVLGTSNPESVQKAVEDWDKFFQLADKMKNAGYKMVSGPDDIKYAMLDQKKTPWVIDDILNMDPVVTEYLEASKKLYDGDYTNKTKQGDSEWESGFDCDVFGWFVSPQYIQQEIHVEKHNGEFNVCQGPSVYHLGGTYLNVATQCPDMALAALILRTLCTDEDVMTKMAQETGDFVNNKSVMQKICDEDARKTDILGENNPVSVWIRTAENLDLSSASAYDERFNGFLDKASEDYNSGFLEKAEDAVELVRSFVADAYQHITVE